MSSLVHGSRCNRTVKRTVGYFGIKTLPIIVKRFSVIILVWVFIEHSSYTRLGERIVCVYIYTRVVRINVCRVSYLLGKKIEKRLRIIKYAYS